LAGMTARIRILLADDHAVLRTGLRMLLDAQPDMVVVGEAGDGREAIDRAQALQPDVILLDLTMPNLGGLAALPQLRDIAPQARVLILTMHDDEGYLRQVLAAGASGYVLKKATDTELLSAIRAVHRGEVYLYSSLTKALLETLLDRQVKASVAGRDPYKVLSEREQTVVRLVALGYTNQEIADQLFLSIKTVETYRARAMEKLGLRSRAALVRFAVEHGWLDDERDCQENILYSPRVEGPG